MKTVIIHYDDKDEIFENTTKVKGCFGGDIFSSYLVIFQGNKKTKVKMYNVDGFEVVN